jgi:myo-inositol-1(or 4)-monophosphatase
MVREAGGFVTDCQGRDDMFTNGDILAGNETMHPELIALLKEANRA